MSYIFSLVDSITAGFISDIFLCPLGMARVSVVVNSRGAKKFKDNSRKKIKGIRRKKGKES